MENKIRKQFRIYDEENELMIYLGSALSICNHWDKDLKAFYLDERDYLSYIDKDTYFMLFTGFIDNNKKEIYEWDIVKVKNSTGKIIKGVVKFIDGCFDIEFLDFIWINGIYKKRDYLKCWIVNYAVEIIGNICQNKELLNESRI